MLNVYERKQMCKNCGTEVFHNIEDATTEEPKTCGAPLKRKGQFCTSKPGRYGLCWRHSKEPHQQRKMWKSQIGGKIVVKATMKLREIAKKGCLKGCSRISKEKMVKLIEDITAHTFAARRFLPRRH